MKTILLLLAVAFQDGFVIKGGDTPKPKPDGSGFVVKPHAQVTATSQARSADKMEWDNYESAVKNFRANEKPLVVMFGASWCGPCKTVWKAIEAENIQGINYAYVDVDSGTAEDIAKRLSIATPQTIPQIVIRTIRDGTEYHQHLGDGQASAANAIKSLRASVDSSPTKPNN